MSHPQASDVTRVPQGLPDENELVGLRRDAVDALLDAEEKERRARQARRYATRMLRQYERRLMEATNHTIEEI